MARRSWHQTFSRYASARLVGIGIPAIPLSPLLLIAAACYEDHPISERGRLQGLVRHSRELAEGWLASNLMTNGAFVYEFNIQTRQHTDGSNIIRQAMAARLLSLLAAEDPSLRQAHVQNIGYLLGHLAWHDGDALIVEGNTAKLGAAATAVRALLASPNEAQYAHITRALARSIVAAFDDNNGFRALLNADSHMSYSDDLAVFYSGEALVALVELAAVTKDTTLLRTAERIQGFYIDRYVKQVEYYWHPAYVPWHTRSMAALRAATNNAEYWPAIASLNDRVLLMQDTTAAGGGVFFRPEIWPQVAPHSSSDAVLAEGMAIALQQAILNEDVARIRRYYRSLAWSVEYIQRLQQTGLLLPQTARGAIKTRPTASTVRLDCIQHWVDAAREIERAIKLMDERHL